MRKILFRGRSVTGKWYYGDLHTYEGVSIEQNGCAFEVIPETVGEYVECLNGFEGDVLYGEEGDEFTLLSSWTGQIKFNDKNGRLMVLDDVGDWYEMDDFMFDRIIGNVHDSIDLAAEFGLVSLTDSVKGRLNAFSETKDMVLEGQAESVTLEDQETFFTEV